MAERPTGTVTFLFTDIEGSTRRWEQQPEAMSRALAVHDELLRSVVTEHGGVIFSTGGDSICAAFQTAPEALQAATSGQVRLQAHNWDPLPGLLVRMALHTGAAELREGDYYGPTLNRCARLLSAGHGGQILCSQVTAQLVAEDLPAGADVIDHGEHRLRDLGRPEHIFEIRRDGKAEYPPLRSLDTVRHNLPVIPTTFFGRERELVVAAKLLAERRLVVLTGVGGCGKTRLALEVGAREAGQYPDAVYFVDLATVAGPGEVATAVMATMKTGAVSVPGVSPTDQVVSSLAGSRALLILDNCEHLVDDCAELAERVVTECPHTRVLATSREAFGIAAEQIFPIPPLDASDGSWESPSSATRLFEARAAAVRPQFSLSSENFAAVDEICRRLDGLPLAIELAAARVAHMSPREIAGRLDQRFRLLTGARRRIGRQQTLQATMEWSHELLPVPERVLLRRLAVFSGAFGLPAVEGICPGGEVEAFAVMDLLGSLVAKSLVVADTDADPVRYRLLETVRAYAEQRLVEAGEAEAYRQGHRDWYLAWLESFDSDQTLFRFSHAFRLRNEYSNWTAALEWSALREEWSVVARFVAATSPFWHYSVRVEELSRWVRLAVDHCPHPSATRSMCLLLAAWNAMLRFSFDLPERVRAATDPAEVVGPPVAFSWGVRGLNDTVIAEVTKDVVLAEQAVAEADRGLSLAGELGDELMVLAAKAFRSMILLMLGRVDETVDELERTLASLPGGAEDFAFMLAQLRHSLAAGYHVQGRDTEAAAVVQTLLRSRRDVSGFIAFETFPATAVLAMRDDIPSACSWLVQEAGVRAEQIGALPGIDNDFILAAAELAAWQKDWERVARLLGAASNPRGRTTSLRNPSSWVLYKHYVPMAREALGSERGRELRDIGRAMPAAEALAYALEGLEDTAAD